MKYVFLIVIAMLSTALPINAGNRTVNLKVAYTTDVHGNFFPYNFITREPWSGSMARVVTAIDSLRTAAGKDNVILLDNGDILQGQPSVYYYNYIDTTTLHPAARIYDYLGYDAATVGNHDIETGHAVYDRWAAQTTTPILAANIIDNATGRPYFKPYHIMERNGVKIAVLGMITPAIPAWLPENLWHGLSFEDMETSAAKWIDTIRKTEAPHIIIGLFHAGHDASRMTGKYKENASMEVAKNVPGFDLVLMGHDHQRYCSSVENTEGSHVPVINPANNANAIGIGDITVTLDSCGNIVDKQISAGILDISELAPSQHFLDTFSAERDAVMQFVSRQIGNSTGEMSTQDAFFGPSAFMSLLHRLQLEISGADISFAAPLSFNALISEGPVRISDMFTLYKYENMLYTIAMSGREIKDYLEESYSLWTDVVTGTQPHLIKFESHAPSSKDNRLKNPAYNFDSAAGINYSVDITKPKGEKITIHSMSTGEPFDLDRTYSVAVNSYRANGGGDHLTKGAGIQAEQLSERVITATDKDLRFYLIKAIERNPAISPKIDYNWKFIPESIAEPAIRLDRAILFSPDSSKEQK